MTCWNTIHGLSLYLYLSKDPSLWPTKLSLGDLAHTTSFTTTILLFSIEVPIQNQESERLCICVQGVSAFYDSSIWFWNSLIMWYFWFSFYYTYTTTFKYRIWNNEKNYLWSLCSVNTKREPLDIETGPILCLLLCSRAQRNERDINICLLPHGK